MTTREQWERLTPWQKGAAAHYERDRGELPQECPYARDTVAEELYYAGRKAAARILGETVAVIEDDGEP